VAGRVAGPGVCICNECIDLCKEIVGMEPMPQLHVWHEQSDDELLASLARVQAAAWQLDADPVMG
jgi:ATP-dependent protease Clp ATPase subunit